MLHFIGELDAPEMNHGYNELKFVPRAFLKLLVKLEQQLGKPDEIVQLHSVTNFLYQFAYWVLVHLCD